VLQATASTTVALLPGGTGAGAEPRPPSDKLNIGVIGVGNRGVSNLAEIKSENIAALCDVDSRYLDAMSVRYPAAKTYEDFRDLIDQPGLDAVLISTPDHTHFHAAMQAIQQRLHVYCEKPLAHSIWEVRELAKAARQSQVVTQTGNQHHASEGYCRAVEIIRSGVLGPIREVHAWTTRPIWPQGLNRPAQRGDSPQELNWDLWLGPAPDRPYDSIYHPRGWRGWFDFGCGALGDMGPHLLDPVVWALDLRAPKRIESEVSGRHNETFPKSSVVRFQFPERGDEPPVEVVWYDGDKQPPKSATGIERLPPNGVFFLAERGKLFAPDYGRRPAVLPNERGDTIELPEVTLSRTASHHQEWINACKGEGQTSSDFSYGARLTEICLLGNLAVRTGKAFEWDGDKPVGEHAAQVAALMKREYRAGWNAIRVTSPVGRGR
jgi:predicted dehydrogenase